MPSGETTSALLPAPLSENRKPVAVAVQLPEKEPFESFPDWAIARVREPGRKAKDWTAVGHPALIGWGVIGCQIPDAKLAAEGGCSEQCSVRRETRPPATRRRDPRSLRNSFMLSRSQSRIVRSELARARSVHPERSPANDTKPPRVP